MPGIVTNQDYTKQINDAFSALKYASPQQLQAVAQQVQGNPQSPEALALAMATQFQQEARQPHPAPPQGTVLQQKLASIAPQGPGIGAVAPNQMAFNQAAQQDPMRNAGIGAAPENTPQMATGGLVSLAHGGPVQGYAGGGGLDVPHPKLSSHETSWGPSWTLDNLVHLDDTPSQSAQDYYKTTEPSPSKRRELSAAKLGHNDTQSGDQTPTDAAGLSEAINATNQNPDFSYMDESPSSQMPKIDLASLGSTRNTPPSGDEGQTIVVDTGDEPTPTATPAAERTSGGSSSKVPKLSFDKQVEGLASLFAGDHAKAAELKGAMEKRLAESSRSHNLEDVAAGIAGMLSSRGYMSQRLGAGALMGLASRGRHGDEEDALQGKIDALGLNEETQSNAARHEALKSIIGAQAKSAEQQQEQLNKLAQLDFERRTKFGEHNIQGQWGVQREGVQGKNAQTLQEAKAKEDRLLAAFEHKLKTTENLTQKDILTAYSNVAGHFASSDLGYTPEEIRSKIAPYMGPYASMLPGGAPQTAPAPLGGGLFLSTP
jgi:hypothetical protein